MVQDISRKLYNEGFTESRMLNENPDLNCVTEAILNSELEQEPSLEEVCKCLSSLKCGKAAGSSGIVAEMLKAGGQLVAEKLWCGMKLRCLRIGRVAL